MQSVLPNSSYHIGARFMIIDSLGNSAMPSPKITTKIMKAYDRGVG